MFKEQPRDIKVQSFKNQIRKSQRNQIFAQKRKLFAQQLHQESDINLLDQYVTNLKNQQNISETLKRMGNILYQAQILVRYESQKSKIQLTQLCRNIFHLIFNVVIPSLPNFTVEGLQSRKNCLVIISNILADINSPKEGLIEYVSDGLSTIYGSLSEYGNTIQIQQIGWILGNIVCHRLKISQSQLEQPLQIILSWIEQILTIKNQQLLSFLYRAITIFFKNIDSQFNIDHHNITQYFKTYRLILLEQAVQLNCTVLIGSSLTHLLIFVDENFNYLKLCDHTIERSMLQKCLKMFPNLCQQKMLTYTLRIILKLSKNQQFAIYIYYSSLGKLITILASFSMPIKQQCLQIINQIIINEEQARQLFNPDSSSDFQQLLKTFIRNIRDCDILMEIIKISLKIIDLTRYECGKDTIATIEDNLLMKNGVVGDEAYKIVEYYSLKQSPNSFGPF